DAIIEGLVSAGCYVLNIGQTPSPVNYFTTCILELDAGVQVTASHNPAQDNGIKLCLREAHAYAGEDLQHLRRRIDEGKLATGMGRVEHHDATIAYLEHLQSLFEGVGEGLRIAVDSG